MKKILMGSVVLLVFTLSICLFQFASCKKANAQTPNVYSIEGLWRGTYTVDGNAAIGSQELNLIIKPDGTMVNDSKYTGQQHIALGTWSLTNSTDFESNATCIYGYSHSIGATQKHTAKFDKSTGKLTMGIYVNTGSPSTGSGTITLTKVY